jgi:UBX domain-containing protein 1/4
VQGALQWLEDNQDKPLEELQAAGAGTASKAEEGDEEGGPSIAPVEGGEGAKSLVCNECGKKFRNPDLASYHATKT